MFCFMILTTSSFFLFRTRAKIQCYKDKLLASPTVKKYQSWPKDTSQMPFFTKQTQLKRQDHKFRQLTVQMLSLASKSFEAVRVIRVHSGCFFLSVFPLRQTQNVLEGLHISSGLWSLWDSPEWAAECCWPEQCLCFAQLPISLGRW